MWRMGATMFALFGTMAVVLAGVGVYGALALSTRQPLDTLVEADFHRSPPPARRRGSRKASLSARFHP
jgi:hypothetical protein